MNDFDNQVEENEKDYDLLAIDTDEADLTNEADEVEIDDTVETKEVESEEDQETVDEVESLEDLEVKYLHDVKKLKDIPKDELKTLVQKGMNHDRLVEKVEGYKAIESSMAEFEEIASLYNIDVASLKESLLSEFFERKANDEGLTPEIVKREYNIEKKEKSTQSAEQQTAKQNERINAFVEAYPNIGNDQIKPETWEKFERGVDLIVAYEQQVKDDKISLLESKLLEMEGKQKTNNQNAETKKKAVVKSTLSNGSDDPDKNDDFLQGLFGS